MCCCRVVIVVCLQGSATVGKGLLSCAEGVVVVVKEIDVGAEVVLLLLLSGRGLGKSVSGPDVL